MAENHISRDLINQKCWQDLINSILHSVPRLDALIHKHASICHSLSILMTATSVHLLKMCHYLIFSLCVGGLRWGLISVPYGHWLRCGGYGRGCWVCRLLLLLQGWRLLLLMWYRLCLWLSFGDSLGYLLLCWWWWWCWWWFSGQWAVDGATGRLRLGLHLSMLLHRVHYGNQFGLLLCLQHAGQEQRREERWNTLGGGRLALTAPLLRMMRLHDNNH